jgi:hypothetical protein
MPSELISQTSSTSDLSQKVLEMATTGVYRESVFEALQPLATKPQIRAAIAHAKRFGLHSIASLRDPELGTYYQLDLAKYQKLRGALHQPTHLGTDADLTQRLTHATQTTQRMLLLVRSITGLWAFLSLLCWVAGWGWVSGGCLWAAVGTGIVWGVQQKIGGIAG